LCAKTPGKKKKKSPGQKRSAVKENMRLEKPNARLKEQGETASRKPGKKIVWGDHEKGQDFDLWLELTWGVAARF